MIDFPASPTVGQTFSAAGVTWTWDGTKWLPSGLSPTVVGGINDNRIINGDMRIDQRNNGASGTALTYTVDRWAYGGVAAKGTWGRNLNVITGPAGFPYYWGFQSSSAYTPVGSDSFQLYHAIEADLVSDFAWGTSSAQSVTLSFWARSSLTGTFTGSLTNYAGTRGYPFIFSLPAANTWTRIAITIPGDTAGTWVMSGNGGSMYLTFDLGTVAGSRGPANVWGAAFIGATGSVNVVATNAATFYLSGVKLEIGNVATPYNRQSLAKSLADCQRYAFVFSGSIISNTANAPNAGYNYFTQLYFPVSMRAAPTVTNMTFGTSTNVSTNGSQNVTSNKAEWFMTAAAGGQMSAPITGFIASAEL